MKTVIYTTQLKFATGANQIDYKYPYYIESIRSLLREVANIINDGVYFEVTHQIVTLANPSLYDAIEQQNWDYVKSLDLDMYRDEVEEGKGIPSVKIFEQLAPCQELIIHVRAYQREL